MDYEKLLAKARATNCERDKIDKKHGLAQTSGDHPWMCVRTAMQAIECGIRMDDWTCVAEGQAILDECLPRLELIWRVQGEPLSGGGKYFGG